MTMFLWTPSRCRTKRPSVLHESLDTLSDINRELRRLRGKQIPEEGKNRSGVPLNQTSGKEHGGTPESEGSVRRSPGEGSVIATMIHYYCGGPSLGSAVLKVRGLPPPKNRGELSWTVRLLS